MESKLNIIVTDETIPIPNTGDISSESLTTSGVQITPILSMLFLTLISIIVISIIRTRKRRELKKFNSDPTKIKNQNLIESIFFASCILGLFLGSSIERITSNAVNSPKFSVDDTTIYVTRSNEENTFATASSEITLHENFENGYNLNITGDGKLKLENGTEDDIIEPTDPTDATLSINSYGITIIQDDLNPDDEIWGSIPFFTRSESKPYESGDKIKITYGVYIDDSLPAGKYTGTLKYDIEEKTCTAIFNANGGIFPDGQNTIYETVVCGKPTSISIEDPIKSSYTFGGYYTLPFDKDNIINTDNNTITITINDDTEYFAYYKKTIDNIDYMQDFNNLTQEDIESVLESMEEKGKESKQLEDTRDEKTYWISLLDDGNIWMTQNLDLNLSPNNTFTSKDTDLSLYGSLGYDEENGYSCSTLDDDCSNGTITWQPADSANTLDFDLDSDGNIISPIPDDSSWQWNWENDEYHPYSANFIEDNNELGHQAIGNYYNWTTAIASNDSTLYTNHMSADNSICPAGWKLPTASNGTDDSEYGTLLDVYADIYDWEKENIALPDTTTVIYRYIAPNNEWETKILGSPLFFQKPGAINGSVVYYKNSHGYYITNSIDSNITTPNAYFLDIGNTGITPANSAQKRTGGISVRCLVRTEED